MVVGKRDIVNDEVFLIAGREQPVGDADLQRIRPVARVRKLTELVAGRLVLRADEEHLVRAACLPLVQPRAIALEACKVQMVLLPEQLARAEADAGHVGLESLLDSRELRPEPHQPDAILVRRAAQLCFALRRQTQEIRCNLVELRPTRCELTFQPWMPLVRSRRSSLSSSRVPSMRPCSSMAIALNIRAEMPCSRQNAVLWDFALPPSAAMRCI